MLVLLLLVSLGNFFFIKINLFILYMWVHCSCLQTHQKREGIWSHYRRLWATMWLLGIELRTSGRDQPVLLSHLSEPSLQPHILKNVFITNTLENKAHFLQRVWLTHSQTKYSRICVLSQCPQVSWESHGYGGVNMKSGSICSSVKEDLHAYILLRQSLGGESSSSA